MLELKNTKWMSLNGMIIKNNDPFSLFPKIDFGKGLGDNPTFEDLHKRYLEISNIDYYNDIRSLKKYFVRLVDENNKSK
jgi:hypothetical protein